MAQYVAELWIPSGVAVPQLGTLQLSVSAPTGPWTDLATTEPLPLQDVLAAWQALATAAIPALTFTFGWTPEAGVSLGANGTCYVLLSQSQAELLGYTNTLHLISTARASDVTPSGIAAISGLSVSPPAPRSQAELYEWRGGRFASFHSQRETWRKVEALIPEVDVAALENGALLRSGLVRLNVGESVYDLSPVPESLQIDQVEGQEAEAILTFDCVEGR